MQNVRGIIDFAIFIFETLRTGVAARKHVLFIRSAFLSPFVSNILNNKRVTYNVINIQYYKIFRINIRNIK